MTNAVLSSPVSAVLKHAAALRMAQVSFLLKISRDFNHVLNHIPNSLSICALIAANRSVGIGLSSK